MKKTLVSLIAIMFLFAPLAFGVMINDINAGTLDGSDAGKVDTYLGSTNELDNSNKETETAWVNKVLGSTTTTFVIKDEDIDYFATDTTDVFGFYLGTPVVEYFLLKNATWWALFQNLDDMLWGVFNTSSLPDGMNLPSSDFTISHVTRFNAVPVPEPSALLLFGAGIAGLALYRRKRS